MQELAEAGGIEVDCLGGRLRSLSQSFVGLAEAALERKSFDRVFLGADAVTAEHGICEADHAQTRLKELMARRGNSVFTCWLIRRSLARGRSIRGRGGRCPGLW
jgi:DeoR/GlpR family transcriptional regulator of sugar metabolism